MFLHDLMRADVERFTAPGSKVVASEEFLQLIIAAHTDELVNFRFVAIKDVPRFLQMTHERGQ